MEEERLRGLDAKIKELMQIGGTVGLSLGVYQKGKAPYFANFGYRDAANRLPVTENTIFPACSLTKLFLGLAAAHMVTDTSNPISWDTPVRTVVPDFAPDDAIARENSTLADLFSHRTGLSCGHGRLASNNTIIIPASHSLQYINDQSPAVPFRREFLYNNLGYELAGHFLSAAAAPRTWADLLRDVVFEPLGLRRTFVGGPPPGTDDVARAYNTLDGAVPVEIRTVQAGEGRLGGASGGMFSCVADLGRAYAAILEEVKAQFDEEEDDDSARAAPPPQPPLLAGAKDVFTAQVPMMTGATMLEATYGFGVARVQLPNSMGAIGLNASLVGGARRMPVVARGTGTGAGAAPTLVFYHQGCFPGALAAAAMVPARDTAVVVMSNSLALCDTPDWVLQLVLEEMLEAPMRNDFAAWARRAVEGTLAWHPRVVRELEERRRRTVRACSSGRCCQQRRPLRDYVGTYWNKARYVKIVVVLSSGGKLRWAIQGLPEEFYDLDHYEHDTFVWLRPRDELAARGRWIDQEASFWKLAFSPDENGEIAAVTWVHEYNVPAGETFFKDPPAAHM